MVASNRATRLKNLINELGTTQKIFAKRVGIQSSYVSQMVRKVKPVTEQTAMKIVEAYPRVRFDWIMYNRGTMFMDKDRSSDETSEPNTEYQKSPKGIFREVEDLLNDLREKIQSMEKRISELEKPKSD